MVVYGSCQVWTNHRGAVIVLVIVFATVMAIAMGSCSYFQ